MRTAFKAALIGAVLAAMFCADVRQDARFGVTLFRNAHAIIGLPFTPLSFAGVARRTAFRAAAYGSMAAASAAAATPPAPPPPPPAAAAPPPPAAAPEGKPLPLGTVVGTLPAGCISTPVGGQTYFYCGGNFYRPAFSGNNLVYVVAKP